MPVSSIVCPKYKGRRVVFDPASLMLTVALPIAMLVDSDSDSGITKKQCPTCRGYGYLHLPD